MGSRSVSRASIYGRLTPRHFVAICFVPIAPLLLLCVVARVLGRNFQSAASNRRASHKRRYIEFFIRRQSHTEIKTGTKEKVTGIYDNGGKNGEAGGGKTRTHAGSATGDFRSDGDGYSPAASFLRDQEPADLLLLRRLRASEAPRSSPGTSEIPWPRRIVLSLVPLVSRVGLPHLVRAALLANHSESPIAIWLGDNAGDPISVRPAAGNVGPDVRKVRTSKGTLLPRCPWHTHRDCWGGGAIGPRRLQTCTTLARSRRRQ